MILEIVTNQEVGEKIQLEFNRIKSYNLDRSFILLDITDYVGYTTVQIVPKPGRTIEYSEIFWLGFFVGFDFCPDLINKK
jgi:hypothetical protein